MVIKFEHWGCRANRHVSQFFSQKSEMLKDDCVPNGSTDKVAAWGGSYLFMKYDVFRQNEEFF